MLPYRTTRITNFKEQDDFFSDKAFEYIKNNFGSWLKLIFKKTLWFFNAHEFPRNFDVYHFARFSPITKIPFIGLWLILPLALAGMIFSFNKKNISTLLMLSIILLYSFSIILIFVAGRYRLPIIPLLIIFAAWFIIFLYDKFKEKNFKLLGISLSVTIILFFLTEKKFFEDEYYFNASPVFTNVLIANTLQNAGRNEEGKIYLDEAVNLYPVDESTDEALFELGHYYRNRDKIKSEEYFLKAVRLDSTNFKAWNSLGFDYKMAGKFEEAISCLQKGISTAPCFPELYLNLADCYLIRKKTDSAVVVLESYYKNCPSPHPNISTPLGKIYMDVYGNFEKAKKYYEESVLYPQGIETSAETFNRLGSCYYKLGEKEKAKETWLNGLKTDPENRAIKINLAFAEKNR
jgi:tetratricopeptide (TPR) repeat protein